MYYYKIDADKTLFYKVNEGPSSTQYIINNFLVGTSGKVKKIICKATTPLTITASAYKAHSVWSNYSSIIQTWDPPTN